MNSRAMLTIYITKTYSELIICCKMGVEKVFLVLLLSLSVCLSADPDLSGCEVAAKTEQGWVCGKKGNATNGAPFAQFLGMRYALPPLGERRFQELHPAEPYDGIFNATQAAPICPQYDVFYEPLGLAAPNAMSEDCIRINVYVPLDYLPSPGAASNDTDLLSILFWIHGGGFAFGSGDPDFHGAEYLLTKNIILVTINYRLHALGFLSFDNQYIPGNNGLRDVITALKWVQKNIKSFGGDPAQVTVGGQSAGGVMTHLLSISPAAVGLFKQGIGLSGLALSNFYTYSQTYEKLVNPIFLSAAGINPVQSEKQIYDDLVAAPIENIIKGTKALLDIFGIVSMAPVVEKPQANFTTVLPKSPEELLDEGAGNNITMLIGFCSNEAQSLRQRLIEVAIELKLKAVPPLTLPQNVLFNANPLIVPVLTTQQLSKYFNVTFITLDKFLTAATDGYYKYPAQRVSTKRLESQNTQNAAKTYLYQFGYAGERSPVKIAQKSNWTGAGHVEDVTYFFRLNTFLGPQTEPNELAHTSEDNKMKDWMTTFITNFVITGSPVENENDWPATQLDLKFQDIETPLVYNFTPPTPYMEDKIEYFNNLYKTANIG